MRQRLSDQHQDLQQPPPQRLVSYSQQQQWPNQPAAADDPSDDDDLDDDDDAELSGIADPDPDPIDPADGAGAEADDDDEPGDAPVDGLTEALRAERRKSNQLERDLRTMKRQLNQLSKINPEEYERLKEADRQRQDLEREIANRERQLQQSADRKVRTVARERDEALRRIDELRKERLLERLFIDADGRPGGDNRGSFFEIFKQQVGSEFRLLKDGKGRDQLEPIDSKGNVLLGDDGALTAAAHVESLRTHPVLSFLFQQRGGLSGPSATVAEFDDSGQLTNLQQMSTAELYRASYAQKPAGARR